MFHLKFLHFQHFGHKVESNLYLICRHKTQLERPLAIKWILPYLLGDLSNLRPEGSETSVGISLLHPNLAGYFLGIWKRIAWETSSQRGKVRVVSRTNHSSRKYKLFEKLDNNIVVNRRVCSAVPSLTSATAFVWWNLVTQGTGGGEGEQRTWEKDWISLGPTGLIHTPAGNQASCFNPSKTLFSREGARDARRESSKQTAPHFLPNMWERIPRQDWPH